MSHSERIERIFQSAKSTWKNPPACPFNRDLQHAAVHLYAGLPLWERAARSVAYALKEAPVLIQEDDHLIGRQYLMRFLPPEEEDEKLRDYTIQQPGLGIGESLFPGYTEMARFHLVTEPVRGHITWDYREILEKGTSGMKKEYREALQTAKDEKAEQFYKGVLILLDAVDAWNERHVAELENRGMTREAALCRKVPKLPAETFEEAVQSFYMQYLCVFYENQLGGNGPGQFDKIFWPYLKSDLQAGRTTLEDARELVDELFIRMDERVAMNDLWNEMILAGGTFPDGTGAVSPLSTMMVESVMDLNITHPSVYMRVPEDAPEDYIRLCAKYLKYGHNRAQIYYDPHVMKALIETNHIAPEDACEFGVGGCLEVGIQGMNSDLLQNAWVDLPMMLELAVTGGYSLVAGREIPMPGVEVPSLAACGSFDEFYEKFLAFADTLIGMSFAMIEKQSEHDAVYRPAYLISSMIHDCKERGRNMHDGGCRYHDYSMTPMGLPNLADGLYAIRTGVFEKKLCSAEELIAAMKADYQGYERLQRQLRALPKYGQEDEGADEFARRVMSDIAHLFIDRKNRFGGIFRPMILTFIYAPLVAEEVGATPDGNNAHSMPAQSLTPQSRSMTCGITAAMNSCTKMPYEYFSGGASAMWDLDPTWASEELIAQLFLTFLKNGAQIFQGNTTDVKELIEAQKHPEDYESLIVRVGGFSARFVGLTKGLQTDIINRRRHQR